MGKVGQEEGSGCGCLGTLAVWYDWNKFTDIDYVANENMSLACGKPQNAIEILGQVMGSQPFQRVMIAR